jgi:hypothetical protein
MLAQPTGTGRFLLVTPTRYEYDAVRAAVADLLGSGALEIGMCGMGFACAAAFCRELAASTCQIGGLALVGWAGGLSPDLAAGDVVLASTTLNREGDGVPCTVIPLPGARVGRLLTVAEALLTPADKADAHRKSGGALAAEMEAYPLATWAWKQGIPFVHARVILDAAGEALPDLGDALNPTGGLRYSSLARRLLAKPGPLLTLLHVVRRSRALAPVLGSLARAVVSAAQAT